MPFSGTSEYEPGHFDRVYDYLIKPACELANFEPIRGDDSKSSNMIMLDVLRNIIECDMAICDLSSINANVFYELGLRQAFDKKTILIRDGLHAVPFDLLGFRYVPYTPSLRVDTVKSEVNEIAAMLLETHNDSKLDANSIVSILKMKPATIDTKNMNPEESMMFEVLNRMKRLERIIDINTGSVKATHEHLITSNKSLNSFSEAQDYYISQQNIDRLLNLTNTNAANFETLSKVASEKLNEFIFHIDGKMLGFYSGKTPAGLLEFRFNDSIQHFPDNISLRKKILSY